MRYVVYGALLFTGITEALLPNLPLSTSGRWLVDQSAKKITFAGMNWPGHMHAMIPEGLQYSSIEDVITKLKSIGINSIRLTYATEMMDNIIEQGRDTTIRESFVKSMGKTNATDILHKIIRKNPSFSDNTTRLQVFDAVAAECKRQGIMIHLDNHISRAEWCCNTKDGNSWFGDMYFNTAKWKRGWTYMANHTKSWPALASVGLRNELRPPDNNLELKSKRYNWGEWWIQMKSCTEAVYKVNPNLVIFLSGLGFDTDLGPLTSGNTFTNDQIFRLSDFPKNKTALELHNYSNSKDCIAIQAAMIQNGWNALNTNNPVIIPVVMTEFGFKQENDDYRSIYAQCMKEFFIAHQAGWMYWAIAGSYYLRQEKEDFDETWGLFNHNWTNWRNPTVVKDYFEPLIKSTWLSSMVTIISYKYYVKQLI